jgi:LCP family protein required for cell wall assembly
VDWEETRKWDLSGLPTDGAVSRVERRRSGKRRKKRIFRFLGVLLALLLVPALVVGGFYLAGGDREILEEDFPSLAPAAAAEQVTPVLLLGVDSRHPNEPARSDTIILAFLDRQKKSVSLLSIPRDTYAFVPGMNGEDKINVAYALGGPQAAAEAVSHLLGIEVKHYVVTDFQGFERIIDTLGGVTINVEEGMYYAAEGIHIDPGVQRLNGHDALGYVRYRNYPMGDIDRIKHQQIFFQALADEATRVSNIWKIPALARELIGAVDTNLKTLQLIELAQAFKGIDGSGVKGYILPGDPQYIDGLSYWVPREEEIEPLVEALMEGVSPPAKDGGKASGDPAGGAGQAE